MPSLCDPTAGGRYASRMNFSQLRRAVWLRRLSDASQRRFTLPKKRSPRGDGDQPAERRAGVARRRCGYGSAASRFVCAGRSLMLQIAAGVKVYLALKPVDMRRHLHGAQFIDEVPHLRTIAETTGSRSIDPRSDKKTPGSYMPRCVFYVVSSDEGEFASGSPTGLSLRLNLSWGRRDAWRCCAGPRPRTPSARP